MSEQIDQIATAAAKAQTELRPAAKDAVNPAFRSRYSDEAAIREASRVYAKHGVAIFQEPVMAERGIAVTTLFAHTSGQWLEFGPLTVPLGKQDAHGVGSATTYAKRYALQAAAGIASDDDDDGNAASQPTQARPQAVVRAPEGFSDFVSALEDVAVEGADALKAFWTKAPANLRKHLTDTDNARWERIKAKAAQHTQVPA